MHSMRENEGKCKLIVGVHASQIFITKVINNNYSKIGIIMMKLTISRCIECSKVRLVDKVNEKWICFACKQKVNKASKKLIAAS